MSQTQATLATHDPQQSALVSLPGLSTDDTLRRLYAAFFANRSKATLAAYSQDMTQFGKFLGISDPIEILRDFLGHGGGSANLKALEFRGKMLADELASATINRRLATLRMLVKLAATLQVVTWELQTENVKQEARKNMRGPGLDGFLDMLDKTAALRDRAIIHLLFGRGLRRNEVVNLDMDDVNLHAGTISVRGKGRREAETLALAEPTVEALREWIAERGNEPGALFWNRDPSHKGDRRLTGSGIFYLVGKMGEAIGKKVRPHGLRHAAITEALDRTNGNPREVMKFSRHKSIATVMIYDDQRNDDNGRSIANAITARMKGKKP